MTKRSWGLFVYPWDFEERTLPQRLERIRALGIDRIVCAAMYHDGRQLLPGGPQHVTWIRGGTSFVPVRRDRYPCELVLEEDGRRPGLVEIRDLAAAAELDTEAWTVTLHRDDLLERPAETVPLVTNAFGERLAPHLCPSAPDTSAYLDAHLADLADAGVARVTLEGCHFPGLLHGYHHESFFAPLDERAQWLASLCFCSWCLESAAGVVDVERARSQAISELQAAFRGDGRHTAELDVESLSPELGGLAATRCDAVLRLAERACASTLNVRFGDQATVAGAIFRTGQPGPRPSASHGWQFGLDYAKLGRTCEALVVLGYLTDISDLRRHLDAYQERGVEATRTHIVLRHFPPDVDNAKALRAKLELVIGAGVARVDFYNLGFGRERDLHVLGEALASVS